LIEVFSVGWAIANWKWEEKKKRKRRQLGGISVSRRDPEFIQVEK
jgi:hypothetical protein